MEIITELSKIVTQLEERNKIVTKRLQACPQGHLSFVRQGKSGVLVQELKVDGMRKRHKLSRDEDLAKALICKLALQDESESLHHNIKLLKATISQIKDYSINQEIHMLLKQNPFIKEDLLENIYEPKVLSSWANEAFEQSMYRPEERRQINSHGLKLRSKSEVLISEKLYEYGLEFHYEQVIRIRDTSLVPDFIIRRSDGKKFVWEHEGLTNVQSYLKWQDQKAKLYASIGIVPWDNLIVTYDNSDGIIDLRIVESEIKNKLII